MHKILNFIKTYKSYIFLLIIIALALKVFLPQLDNLKDSLAALKGADKYWVFLSLLVFFSGLPILTWQYMVLAIKKIPFKLTLKVEVAGLFVSKLLPSSLGTLSLNMYYFTKQKHSAVEAGTVMAMNAFTSGIAYAILIIMGFIMSGFTLGLDAVDFSQIPYKIIILAIFGIILFCLLMYRIPAVKSKVNQSIKDLGSNLKGYNNRRKDVFLGILLNGIGSLTSVFALYASAQALGVDISMTQALVAYTFGNIAAGLVPTPGGLGAAEAGIYAGLMLVGLNSVESLSVMLLYRLVSYWIPIIPGYIAFWDLRKSVLSKFSFKSNSSNLKS